MDQSRPSRLPGVITRAARSTQFERATRIGKPTSAKNGGRTPKDPVATQPKAEIDTSLTEKPSASSAAHNPDVGKIADVEATVAACVPERTIQIEDTLMVLHAKISTIEARHDRVDTELRLLRGDVNSILEDLQIPDLIEGQPTITTREVLERTLRRLERVEHSFHNGVTGNAPGDRTSDGDVAHSAPRGGKPRESRKSRMTKTHRDGGDSDPLASSPSDYSDDEYSDTSGEDDISSEEDNAIRRKKTRGTRGGIHARRWGKNHPGLRVIRPTNRLFDGVLDYRRYRLKRRHKRRNGRETCKVKDHMRAIQTGAPELRFDGSDPIKVLGFLSRFVEECETSSMKESQALVPVKYFLQGQARTQFDATRQMDSIDGGISYWPEAVQYPLRTYGMNDAISGAVLHLRDVRQISEEWETSYSARLLDAEFRCGNVHDAEERILLFIDGLNPGIRSLEARYRESALQDRRNRRTITFLDVVQFAQKEGDTLRARSGRAKNADSDMRRAAVMLKQQAPAKPRCMMTMESSEDSQPIDFVERHNGEEAAHLIPED